MEGVKTNDLYYTFFLLFPSLSDISPVLSIFTWIYFSSNYFHTRPFQVFHQSQIFVPCRIPCIVPLITNRIQFHSMSNTQPSLACSESYVRLSSSSRLHLHSPHPDSPDGFINFLPAVFGNCYLFQCDNFSHFCFRFRLYVCLFFFLFLRMLYKFYMLSNLRIQFYFITFFFHGVISLL